MNKGLKVFITYAHKNADAKDKLITYLNVMKQNGLIDVWHDNEILPGDKWRDEIFNNLADSDILLYLTCPYSLASKNCNKELTAALRPNISVIPIILEHCDWKNHQLSEFQALPDKGKPIYDINEWNPESKGWMSVVEGLRKVIEEMPSNVQNETLPKWLLQQGNFLMMLKQINRAVEAYTHAIELKPNYSNAYSNRGAAYIAKEKTESAIADINKAIELRPDFPNAYNNRGITFSLKGDVGRAIEDYTEAIELKPDFAIAYLNRGVAYVLKGKTGLAINDFNKAIELKPNGADAYYNRGRVYKIKGALDLAIVDFTKAIEFKPADFEAYNSRGNAYKDKSEYDLAIIDYNKSIELNPRGFGHTTTAAMRIELKKNSILLSMIITLP